MKKMAILLASIALLSPFAVSAVTWTAESNDFTFPETAVRNRDAAISPSAFSCRAETRAGISKIYYLVPSAVRNAKMDVFRASGALVASFTLLPGGGTVRLNAAGHPAAAGVYWTVMRYGAIEKITKFSIVK